MTPVRMLPITLSLLASLALAALPDGSARGQDRRPPAGSNARTHDKASPSLMTGKVVRVDDKARTFTIASKGQEVTFRAGKLPSLPAVGTVVDVTYTGGGGVPLEAANLNLSKSNIN